MIIYEIKNMYIRCVIYLCIDIHTYKQHLSMIIYSVYSNINIGMGTKKEKRICLNHFTSYAKLYSSE